MATRNVLDTKVLATSASSIISSSISPAGDSHLVLVCLTRTGSSETHSPASGFAGLSWTSYTIQQQTGSDRVRISVHWALLPASPGSATAQVNFTGATARRALKVINFIGYDVASFVRQVVQDLTCMGTTSTTPAPTLPSPPLAANDVLGFFGSFLGGGGAANILAGDGGGGGGNAFTQESEDQTAAGTNDIDLFIEARTGSTAQTVNASAMAAINNVCLPIEFNVAAAAADPPDGDPSNLVATAVSARQIDLTWDRGSTNNDSVIVQRRSPAGSGAWTTIDTLGAAAESYSDDDDGAGLDEQTEYEYQVIESNGDGDSDPSNAADDTTLARPVVTRVNPASGTRSLPVLGLALGSVFDFEVDANDAEDGALTGASVEWFIDDPLGAGAPFATGVLVSIDVDVDLVTAGVHTLVAIATDSSGDVSDPVGWNITVAAPGTTNKILTEGPLFDTPLLFGTGKRIRGVKFRGPDGNYVQPTFEAGDVMFIKDADGELPATNLPIQQEGDNFYFDVDASETDGEQTIYTFKDLSDPPVWVPNDGRILTYGNEGAFYAEQLQELGDDDRALLSIDNVGADPTEPPGPDATIMAKIDALYAQVFNKSDNNGVLEQTYSDDGLSVIWERAVTKVGALVTKLKALIP